MSPRVSILVTGDAFLGKGMRSIETVIEELIENSENEIQITTYSLTDWSERFIVGLQKAAARGVTITIVINNLSEQNPSDSSEKMKKLSELYPHVKLLSFDRKITGSTLHAKLLVVDRKIAIVGSANFTYSGMTKNQEIAVQIRGDPSGKIAECIDALSLKAKSKI